MEKREKLQKWSRALARGAAFFARAREHWQGAPSEHHLRKLKDLPRGTALVLRQKVHLDKPFHVDGRTYYTLRYPIYTAQGPLTRDLRMDEFHCRLDHFFSVRNPVVIPSGTEFRLKEGRGFVVGSSDEGGLPHPERHYEEPYYVAALRIQNDAYPELFSIGCFSKRGSVEPITVGQFEKVMGWQWLIDIPGSSV